MIAATEHLSHYLASFEELGRQRETEPAWLREARGQAMERFSKNGFPTVRQEDFKYTNLAPLAKTKFRRPGDVSAPLSTEQMAPFSFDELEGNLLVFVNGRFSPERSRIDDRSGAQAGSLAASLAEGAGLIQTHLTHYSNGRENTLAALNTALFEDGAFVHIPDRAVIDQPIHLLFVTTADEAETLSTPRILIVAGRDSQATVIESYVGLQPQAYWTNVVTEIVAASNARLDHYRLQQEQLEAFHTSFLEIRQDRDSNVTTNSLSLGSRLARNDIDAVLEDEAAECTLNGLYAVNGRQHVDNHTCIDHTKPHCTSHELYKGVLDGHSRGVFSGKIIVRPDAQKTDAYQNNKNLLLSENADINTKPQLQIDANDVKCSHGATIGQIDEESVFYLRSRGISHDDARSLLTYAFAADILERVKVMPIRRHFEQALMNWLTAPHPAAQQADEGRPSR